MITLTLLHPVQATPVQSWTFEHESVVRIGRAVDNHVVLYSAVVSRHHVELRRNGLHWEVVNLGTNGTYLDGKRVQQASLNDGGILRLARSGPNIQIRIGSSSTPASANARMDTMPERGTIPEQYVDPAKMTIGGVPTEPETKAQAKTQAQSKSSSQRGDDEDEESERKFHVVGDLPLEFLGPYQAAACEHSHCTSTDFFCPDCGYPLKVQQSLGAYEVIRSLGDEQSFLAWRAGRTVVIKTLPEQATVANRSTFRHQARQLCQTEHLCVPKFYEAFAVGQQPYLATEMIYGPNLQSRVKDDGPLNLQEICQHLRPLCELLDHNHHQHPPLVHQQIHPRNIITTLLSRSHATGDYPAGSWVLVGWGHVAVTTADTGTMMTNIGYLPPEQQTGHGQPASDLYSLGATLVYLLTGYEPDAYFRWGVKEYRLYAEDIPGISSEVADIINQLTDPNPQSRFSSSLQVFEKLNALVV